MTVLLPALVAAGQIPARAQVIDRQIEVVREYVPDVGNARKLDFTPVTTDTVALKPDINYSITPTPWQGVFEARPIAPVRIDAAEFRPERPFYARLALGLPLQTLADLYATATPGDNTVGGLYLNHYGRWSKIENDLGVRERATAVRNVIGAFFEQKFRAKTLSADIRDDYRFFRDYAGANIDGAGEFGASGRRIRFNDVGISVRFGDAFTDFSRFNYRLGVSASEFSDIENNRYDNVGGFFEAGWRMGEGDFTVGLGYSSSWSRTDSERYRDARFALAPKYYMSANDMRLELGIDLIYNKFIDDYNLFIFPDIRLLYDVSPGFVPYFALGGALEEGNIKAISYLNPYSAPGMFVRNPSYYSAVLGAYGSISPSISYDISLGSKLYDNYIYYVSEFSLIERLPGQVTRETAVLPVTVSKKTNIFFAEARIEAHIAKGLTFDLGARYNGVGDVISDNPDYDNMTLSSSLPQFEFDAELKYAYRRKLFLSLGIGILGQHTFNTVIREFRDYDSGTGEFGDVSASMIRETVPTSVNLKFDAEYRITDRINAFVIGDNLLNRRIYRFAYYPELGINFMLGVKLKF